MARGVLAQTLMRAVILLPLVLLACQDLGPAAPEEPTRKPVPPWGPPCPGGRDSQLERGKWVKIYENEQQFPAPSGLGKQRVCIVR